MFGRGEEVTFESVVYQLNEKGMLDKIGGLAYINALRAADFGFNTATFKRLCDDIEKQGEARRLRRMLTDLAADENLDPEKLIFKVVNGVYTARKNVAEEIQDFATTYDQAGDGRVPVVTSTLQGLDELLGGGFVLGDYFIVAARPSIGKTALALQMSAVTALSDIPTLVISLEQSKASLVSRWSRMFPADALRKAPLYVLSGQKFNVEQIVYNTQMAILTRGVQMVVIDYIGLIKGQRANQTKNDFITHVSSQLQGMARSLNIVLLALSQLNREMEREGREPMLADLRDSGSLEQDADGVLFIHRPGKREKTKLILAKQREGPIGNVNARMDLDRGMFFDE